jgi:hypothetical protein
METQTIKSVVKAVQVLKRCGWEVTIDRKDWGSRHSARYTCIKGSVIKVVSSCEWRELVALAILELPAQMEREKKVSLDYLKQALADCTITDAEYKRLRLKLEENK